MGLIAGLAVLFIGIVVLWIMVLTFPSIFTTLGTFVENTPEAEGFGQNLVPYFEFILLFVVPLVFIGGLLVVTLIIAAFRQEARRERI